jgi:hypothetical protein
MQRTCLHSIFHHARVINAHSTSICWGYATGRAFGRSWNDSRCPLNTLYFNTINPTYFQLYPEASLSGIASGDIVVFGANHAAYVITPSSNYNNFKVDQVPNEGGPEQTNVSLSAAIAAYGQPTGYYREKKLWRVTVQNSFTGGKVGVGGIEYDSPYTEGELYWESTRNIDAVMDGRSHDNYVRRFVIWLREGSNYNTSKSTAVTITKYNFSQPENYTAVFKKEFNITFQNNFIGVGNAGIIKVNGQQYTLPTGQPFKVIEPNSIAAEAISGQTYNSIIYTFTQWSDGNTSYSRTFTPNDHATYTANFTGKPSCTPNVSAGGPVGANVQITWSEHPNQNVSEYHLWRIVKHSLTGITDPPQRIAILSRGTTSYTDYAYILTDGYTHDLLKYDVRAYYSTEQSFADANYVSAFGRLDLKMVNLSGGAATQLEPEAPLAYRLLNYPNPFNPSTTIRFDLPEPSFVLLDVYDVRGGLVVTLIKEQKPAGSHVIKFEAPHLPGGVYFYRLQTGGFTKMQKMLLVK